MKPKIRLITDELGLALRLSQHLAEEEGQE